MRREGGGKVSAKWFIDGLKTGEGEVEVRFKQKRIDSGRNNAIQHIMQILIQTLLEQERGGERRPEGGEME